jgi:Tol biopolymer transport system component
MSRAADAGLRLTRFITISLIVCGAALSAPPSILGAERYDPTLRFRTITTPHFYIHFHQGEQDLARRLAGIAEEMHERLIARLGRARSGARTHVILIDQDDLSNGWAMAFPYNVVQIHAAAPSADDLIGNTDDWLRMVFTHEYTHILHLDRAGGLIGGLRYVFGRAPLLFPNQFLPVWQIEGIATWAESEFTGQGRVRSGDFRQILDLAAHTGRFEPVDRVNGGLVAWPDGQAPYAYGGLFHDHLARRFGGRELADLADATGRRLPYLPMGAFDRAFGEDFSTLWRAFSEEIAVSPAIPRAPGPSDQVTPRRLTSHQYQIGAPRWSVDGTHIFYSRSTPDDFPGLMSIVPGQEPRRLANRAGGGRTAVTRDAVLFEQLEYVRSVGLQGDLYRLDLASGGVRRLTREARASDPDVSPDGARVAFVIEERGATALAILDLTNPAAPPRILARGANVQYRAPRWSPDGAAIAAERRSLGGPFEIVIIDPETAASDALVGGPGRNADPEWLRDGRWILFASDRDGGPLDLFAVERRSRRIVRATHIPGGARAPAVSPDGRTIAFIGYTTDGYDLFSIDLPRLDTLPEARSTTGGPRNEATPEARAPWPEAPYGPWRSLYPRYWTPVIEEDNGQIEAGAATTGADALGRHVYAAALTWGSSGASPDWQAGYTYDRWRPTLFATASDDRTEFQGARYRDRTFDFGAFVPFRRVLRLQRLIASLHASEEIRDCGVDAGCAQPGRTGIDRRAVRGGWLFTTARSYGYSISAEDGLTAAAAIEFTREALCASGDATTLTAQVRAFPGLRPRHAILAMRAAAAASWGDASIARRFGAGGSAAESPGGFGRDAVGLLRGYDQDDVVGARAAVLNVDFRIPLAFIERGVGRWPFFLKTVHAAPFVDVGHAWERRFDSSDVKVTFGAELSADTVVGFSLPLTFTAGVAWRHDGSGRLPEGAAVFGRIGRAF